ncbi:MAG: homocysteine S-methyltransferase [Nocardioides sp.]|nr:homocysteine S-methyltransferase [Nocardioides sp.]
MLPDLLAGVPDDPLVLDGGLSTALEQQGADLSGALWTARLLAAEPERIAAAHRAFFGAGAQVATAASYQASVEGFVAAGWGPEEARRLVGRGVRIAREVRDELAEDRPGLLVAASVGPYGAYLADGSEYRGRYGVPAARLRDFHGRRLELLAAAGPDLLAVETIPDADEAAVLVALLEEIGLPAWFSFSVLGATTCAGQPLADAYAVLAGSPAVVAAGVNCSDQVDVLDAVRTAVAVTGLPAVAYPNRGGSWDAGAKRWVYGDPLDLALVGDWLSAGVRLVGGCCGTGPADVAALAQRVAGHDGVAAGEPGQQDERRDAPQPEAEPEQHQQQVEPDDAVPPDHRGAPAHEEQGAERQLARHQGQPPHLGRGHEDLAPAVADEGQERVVGEGPVDLRVGRDQPEVDPAHDQVEPSDDRAAERG